MVKKEYFARKLVGFSQQQMFTVVADVKNYNKFVPFCTKSTIIAAKPGHLKAKLHIGFPPIYEEYTSYVTLVEPRLVKAICSDGRLFTNLETRWRFSGGLYSNPKSCIIDFHINFGFKSSFYNHIATMFFDRLVSRMEYAFINEAKRRYGPESVAVHALDSTEWEGS